MANLFHPDPMLQKAATEAIFRIDPAAYERSAHRLPATKKAQLDHALGVEGRSAA